MKYIKIFEDYKDPNSNAYNIIGNTRLTKILNGDIEAELLEPKDGEFDDDFSEREGSKIDQTLLWSFKNKRNEDFSILVTYSYSYYTDESTFRGDYDRPSDPDKIILNSLNIEEEAYFYEEDEGNENSFILNPENMDLLRIFLEENLPVSEIK